jgi:hypothetical protein
LHIAIVARFDQYNCWLRSSAEIVYQVDPSLMPLRLMQYFRTTVKDASLLAHGGAFVRHVQEKDASLVNQGSQR